MVLTPCFFCFGCPESSLVVVHRLSCPRACGILVPQPGIQLTSLHWKADSYLLITKEVPNDNLILGTVQLNQDFWSPDCEKVNF